MGLKDLSLNKAYSSDYDDILSDFYIPALEASVEYSRLAGFFTSTSLAIAAKGIAGLIRNGGTLRLIVSPFLRKEDLEVISESQSNPIEFITKRFIDDLSNIEDDFISDHVFALGWLLARKRLEIKIALPYKDKRELPSFDLVNTLGIFHQKVGILSDGDGNTISFSGSVNETATGWLNNVEEFKVFRGWDYSEADYVKTDIAKFERFWNNLSNRVQVIDMPIAIKEKLIEIAPKEFDRIDLNKYYEHTKRPKTSLYTHQLEAIQKWLDNGKRGIFEMATGTGKTFAALGCAAKVFESGQPTVVCVTCPFQHLVQQWKKEIEKLGVMYDKLIVADSTNSNWKPTLVNSLMDLSLGYQQRIFVITTHDTFSSVAFTKIIKNYKSTSRTLLIADEVHGLGAPGRKLGLIDEYEYRLGLSATPRRWFDAWGTTTIYDYFEDVVYEFGLERAISTINPGTGQTYLTPYLYKLSFASLSIDELEAYAAITTKIIRLIKKAETEEDAKISLERLLFARANIIKNAESKFEQLERILDSFPQSVEWTIIYCSPQQIDRVMGILASRDIFAHRFTMNEGTTPSPKYNGLSEREYILNEFSRGKYQVLVAMRCLDEGVDIPPAKTAILLSSSGNPREYIQRIGRIIRRSPQKNEAVIHDIVVLPDLAILAPELRSIEQTIIEKELRRYEEISKHALNNAEASSLITVMVNQM